MKFLVSVILILGALSLSGCVTKDQALQPARPDELTKRNTFDDLRPRQEDGGFQARPPGARNTQP